MYWPGQKDDYIDIAFELLGPNLADLFAYHEHHFPFEDDADVSGSAS